MKTMFKFLLLLHGHILFGISKSSLPNTSPATDHVFCLAEFGGPNTQMNRVSGPDAGGMGDPFAKGKQLMR